MVTENLDSMLSQTLIHMLMAAVGRIYYKTANIPLESCINTKELSPSFSSNNSRATV
jgi:hypothetical protein